MTLMQTYFLLTTVILVLIFSTIFVVYAAMGHRPCCSNRHIETPFIMQ